MFGMFGQMACQFACGARPRAMKGLQELAIDADKLAA
jgi:hypothetical protein